MKYNNLYFIYKLNLHVEKSVKNTNNLLMQKVLNGNIRETEPNKSLNIV